LPNQIGVVLTLLACSIACQQVAQAWSRENKITVGFSSGFGVDAKFNTPTIPVIINPGGNAQLKTFDDGHMNMDGTTGDSWTATRQGDITTFEGTWDWSIQDVSQYDSSTNRIRLTEIRPQITSPYTHEGDSGAFPGVHIGYRREARSDDRLSLGFEASLEYQQLSIEDIANNTVSVYQYSQDFSLRPGDPAPNGAYSGILGGTQISTQPINQDVTTTTGANLSRNYFDANMILLRLGMDMQVTLTDRNNVLWGMGVVYAPFKYEYSYSESVQQSPGAQPRVYDSGSLKGNDGLFGAYFQLGWEFTFTEYFRAYLVARHMHTDAWKVELSPDRSVDLLFRNAFFIDSGITLVW
jgi:hypothetical protein